jgi:hypothetical protein
LKRPVVTTFSGQFTLYIVSPANDMGASAFADFQ